MMIRPAKEQDAEAISELWLQLVLYHQQLDENMPIPAEDGAFRYAMRIRYGVDDTLMQVYVAEVDGVIVGYVFGMVIDLLPEMFLAERAGMIGDIFVLDAYRGQGIGTALMHAMKDWFVLRDIGHYEWYVAAKNTAGIRFWQHVMHGEPVMIRMRANVTDIE